MNKPFTIALVGNPNCGKTTLFNRLTGTHQRVGNWPGVTVERKTGSFTHEGRQFLVVDLPGTYSLHVSRDDDALDQQIAQDYVLAREADLIVNIIDASSIGRGLYLSTQLFDASVPVVVALNMVDVAQSQGVHVDPHRLAACLGCPVVPLVASRGDGVRALIEEMCAELQTRQPPPQRMALDATLESALLRLQAALDPADAGPAGRLLAGALLARDAAVLERIGEAARARVLAIVDEVEATLGANAGDALIAARYQAIGTIVDQVLRTEDSGRFNLTDALDRVLLNRVLGFPVFLGIMYLMFMFTINVGGAFIDFFDLAAGALFVEAPRMALDAIGLPAMAGDRHRRRHRRRRADGRHLHPGHRLTLPVPVLPRGLGLHGARRLRHGPPDARDRPAGQVLRAADRRLRLQRAGDHGHAHAGQPARPHAHRDDGAVHVLRRAAAGLCAVRRRVLPAQRPERGVRALPDRHRAGGGDRAAGEADACSARDLPRS